MNPTATVSSEYQISIPKAIRVAQRWEAGVTYAFIAKGSGVLLVPVPELQDLEGIARGASREGYRDRLDCAW
jgi:bifunctional DNA-binding transcriptional regulator/antitoxin component of YhaV-PrlF toxin-antitoxin module